MTAVNSVSLDKCPTAVSGKYRMLEYFGRTKVRQLDFKNLSFNTDDGQKMFDIVPHPTEPCRFSSSGTFDGVSVQLDVVIRTTGAGSYRINNRTSGGTSTGYIFPAQAHPMSAVAGEWNFLQSGFFPGDGLRHFLGKLTLGADGTMSVCDYNVTDGSCSADPEAPTQWTTRTDGGFNLTDGSFQVPLYAYRAPNGSVNLFGTPNPDGLNRSTMEQSHIVAARPRTLTLPVVGTVNKYWDLSLLATNNHPCAVHT
jgi:hypothetical protein